MMSRSSATMNNSTEHHPISPHSDDDPSGGISAACESESAAVESSLRALGGTAIDRAGVPMHAAHAGRNSEERVVGKPVMPRNVTYTPVRQPRTALGVVPVVNPLHPERVMQKVFTTPPGYDDLDRILDGKMDA